MGHDDISMIYTKDIDIYIYKTNLKCSCDTLIITQNNNNNTKVKTTKAFEHFCVLRHGELPDHYRYIEYIYIYILKTKKKLMK